MGSGRRQRVRRRRAVALAGAALAVGAVVVALAACGGDDRPTAAETTATPPLQTLAIIFPEGFTVRDMGERVAAVREIAIRKRNVTPRLTQAGYLTAAQKLVPPLPFRKDWRRERSPEGFLFPALYEFTQATPARDLVADQLDAFRRRWSKVDLRYARSKNLTPYDILIIASMIEKETVVPAERKLVAAVIYNRLRARMPLGIDATIRYGLDIPGTESLTKQALASDNPYNTRLRPGLPPTPIANPGLPSLQAAAHPAQVDYLYFVRKPDKRHHYFTADENDFLRKVCEYGFGCS
jgi:uncharacterized YceG family protein